jgi:group II intron reverse transcriptase/maturase
MDAIRYIIWSTTERKKFFWIIEGDISSYFDTINHEKLVQLLRKRVKDEWLLKLIWKYLRAGVMEGKLFKDTKQGTPQGGIVSPLLANIYLHELDRYMQRHLDLPRNERAIRRKQGKGNYTYVRYADDFVVLCNGTKGEAEAMKEELHEFLKNTLKLNLSKEKTKVTHLNDGFIFLGFQTQRSMGQEGMTTKLLIPKEAQERVLDKIAHATNKASYQDSLNTKIQAINRIISGWCRYYQYTSRASSTFHKIDHKTYWFMCHWIARKFEISMPTVMRKYMYQGSLGTKEQQLISAHTEFPSLRYTERFFKPNPYTTQAMINREELSDGSYWTGVERRQGVEDLRPIVLARDEFKCQGCGEEISPQQAQIDHKRPVRRFKLPVDSNRLDNLQTLCVECHRIKTQSDRRMESPVQ